MLSIRLRQSVMLAAILLLAHGAAIAAIAAVDIPLWTKLVFAAVLATDFFLVAWRAALLRAPGAVVAIEVSSGDMLSVQTRRGGWVECEVLGSTYVTSFLTIVNLKQTASGAGRRVVILPDSIDAEDYRQLRVWLRWKAGGTPP